MNEKMPCPPIELCGYNYEMYSKGILSPSCVFYYLMTITAKQNLGKELDETEKKIKKYFSDFAKYEFGLLESKIENRTATKEEYKRFARENRKKEE